MYKINSIFRDNHVSAMGSTTELEMKPKLQKLGIKLYPPGKNTDVLIVGMLDCHYPHLNRLLDLREEKTLKVYSVEMVDYYIKTNSDPYENYNLLMKYAYTHPVLDYLTNHCGFIWPTTQVFLGWRNITVYSPEIGLLKLLGYTVGNNGLSTEKRHHILQYVFYGELPPGLPTEYLYEWGAAGSRTRLLKLANTLASFARNAKKNLRADLSEAIHNWEDDLEWVRREFYTGRFQFQWPATFIGDYDS